MSRRLLIIAAAVLVATSLGAGSGSSLNGRRAAAGSFDALFGAEARRVAATRDPADDVAFARRLLDAAVEMGDDPAAQALLCERAADFALADPTGYLLAVQAMEFLGKVQPARAASARQALLDRFERHFAALPPAGRRELATVYLDRLLDGAERHAAAGDFDGATALCLRAATVAKAIGPEAEAAARARAKAVSAAQACRRKVAELEARVAPGHRDPAAAAELVRLLVVEQGRVDEAARYLSALGDDATLRRALALARRSPRTLYADEALFLADWYQAQAATAGPAGRLRALELARACYEQFLADYADGDMRRMAAKVALAQAERDLAALRAAPAWRIVDLLPMIDPSVHTVSGEWSLAGLAIASGDGPRARLSIPYRPPEEYDFVVEFTRQQGEGGIAQVLRLPTGNACLWHIGAAQNTYCGLELVRGLPLDRNGFARRIEDLLLNGRRYTSVVHVRRAGVTAEINGQRAVRFTGNLADLSLPPAWRMPDDGLGLGTDRSPTVFHAIRLIEITGQGERLSVAQ